MTANLTPDRYRGVSVTRVDVPLDEAALRRFFVGKEAYFKTRYAVVTTHGLEGAEAGAAIVRILTDTSAVPDEADRSRGEHLFVPITDIELLAGPDETAVIHDPQIDTGIPSDLARAAREQAPGHRAVVVHGRYQHVSFIIDPQPLRVIVREVVPPHPAKLLDQAARLVAVREDLPPLELVPELVDLADLARMQGADSYLLPCRGSGFAADADAPSQPAPAVAYLDEHPPEAEWLMLGCSRSQQIHEASYGRSAPQVDFCPRRRPPASDLVLTKCCLQDDEIVTAEGSVSVPWGASLERVGQALDALVAQSAALNATPDASARAEG